MVEKDLKVVHLGKKSLEPILDWSELIEWLKDGHKYPLAQIKDHILAQGQNRLLNRLAWIEGMGSAVKTCTVYPDNVSLGKATTNGMMTLFEDETGEPEATIDFHLVTKWKTAADSLLAASLLVGDNPRNYLIIGAGAVARSLVEAYTSIFQDLKITIWNRTKSRAMALTREYEDICDINYTEDLPNTVAKADIISCATLAHDPVLKGDWVSPATHIDLIGAFSSEMREADDKVLEIGNIYVDNRNTTIGHIGELVLPMAKGIISEHDIVADFYDISSGGFARGASGSISVFKNGGGAHLDLMTGKYFYRKWQQSQGGV